MRMTECVEKTETPLFAFGIIADVQYADIEDGYNYSKTRRRYYRNALNLLREAINYWKEHTPQVKFVLQLGDIIDGANKSRGTGSQVALDTVIRELDAFPLPVYHNWGNHEFYNFSRQVLMNSVLFSGNMPNCSALPHKAYYTITPFPKLLIISLDCYDVSGLGYDRSDTKYQEAMQILKGKNPNEDKNDPGGLNDEDMRFVKFNGAVSKEQIQWLETTLTKALADRVNVIVLGHVPILPYSEDWICILWNYKEILDVLGHFKNCVLCYLAGHDHAGGYTTDQSGILHVTMPGVIEAPPGTNVFSTVNVYNDKLDIKGVGNAGSFTIPLKFPFVKEI